MAAAATATAAAAAAVAAAGSCRGSCYRSWSGTRTLPNSPAAPDGGEQGGHPQQTGANG